MWFCACILLSMWRMNTLHYYIMCEFALQHSVCNFNSNLWTGLHFQLASGWMYSWICMELDNRDESENRHERHHSRWASVALSLKKSFLVVTDPFTNQNIWDVIKSWSGSRGCGGDVPRSVTNGLCDILISLRAEKPSDHMTNAWQDWGKQMDVECARMPWWSNSSAQG